MRNRLGLALTATVLAGLGLAGCGASSSGDDPAAGGQTREIVHAMGTTKVPVAPTRVVVLDTDKIDTALTLGVTPVGAARAGELTGWPTYIGADATKDIKELGTLQEPNLEAIQALRPDLILGSKFRQEKYYDELAKIAPTVFTENVGKPWKENFLLDGKALGKEELAKEKLAAYEARAKAVGAKIGNPGTAKVSIVRFMPTEIRIYGPESFAGIVVGDTGLGRPERQLLTGKQDRRFDKVSPERVSEVDGTVIFVAAYGPKAAEQQTAVTAGPLWKNLGAVKAGKAHVVPDETWMTGIGVTAAGKILDDLEKHLAA
ncbi:ABC transporter substrate-binding protein [Couchioplanes caeruleus]|uniref:ABC transporter substrate-binding protein n=2 Tax=Couchioplanes caeruleus TaxID=56438 RepID=A0A1K0GJY8_9ACTN|nr:iron-siderophore ABC transporter substrate-binding protein [Couchioplanes caeruleus]OJF11316.1 ABC transporter substrate-binding protein [Couchioplanes caeruleus subsp. caeruleus]